MSWLATTAALCGPGEAEGPPPDSCANPEELLSASLEVGAYHDSYFVPFTEGSGVRLERGVQGADMIGVRLRVTGEDLPTCLAQSIAIVSGEGRTLATNSIPLATYDTGEEGRTTKTLWMPLQASAPSDGSEILLEVRIGNTTLRRSLRLVSEAPFEPGGSYTLQRGGTLALHRGGFGLRSRDLDLHVVGAGTASVIESRSYRVPAGSSEYAIRIHTTMAEDVRDESFALLSTASREEFHLTFSDAKVPSSETQLQINEFYAGEGDLDTNCDGSADDGDAFAELYNAGTEALDLGSLALWEHRLGGELRRLSLSGSIGPGEVRLLMATQATMSDCVPANAHELIGLVPAADADTFELYQDATSISFDTITILHATDASRARVPDFSEQEVQHPLVPATGRSASPATRTDGTPFAYDGVLSESTL